MSRIETFRVSDELGSRGDIAVELSGEFVQLRMFPEDFEKFHAEVVKVPGFDSASTTLHTSDPEGDGLLDVIEHEFDGHETAMQFVELLGSMLVR
jgi:hypothetical protein